MPQLPHTSRNQHPDLYQTIPKRPRIRVLTQIPKISFSFPLILLFSPNILQFQIQVPDLSRQFGNMSSIVFEVGFSSTDDDVEVETDVSVGEPRGVVGGEAEGVVACFVRSKCEATV